MKTEVVEAQYGISRLVDSLQQIAPKVVTDDDFDAFHDNARRIAALVSKVPHADPSWRLEMTDRICAAWTVIINRWQARADHMVS